MRPCRHVATDQPRLRNGHHLRDCNVSGCEGCEPCRERHCVVCGIWHIDDEHPVTCPRCVGYVRTDLADILKLSGRMTGEAMQRGVNSEAAMLAGPAADPELWRRRSRLVADAAADAPDEPDPKRPRHPANKALLAWIEDCRDELHPLWVLGTWEQVWRDHLDHAADESITVGLAADYLDRQLTYMAQQLEPDFAQFASEVRACRSHLEDVVRDSRKPETGAPCPMCGKRDLCKTYGEDEAEDRWDCPDCGASYTEHDYRTKVGAVYVLHAKALTASQIRETYRVPEGSVRAWAALDKVHKRGKDESGRQLYDVADTLAMRDGCGEVSA